VSFDSEVVVRAAPFPPTEAKIHVAAPASRAASRSQPPVPWTATTTLPQWSPSRAPFRHLAPSRSRAPYLLDPPGIPPGPLLPSRGDSLLAVDRTSGL